MRTDLRDADGNKRRFCRVRHDDPLARSRGGGLREWCYLAHSMQLDAGAVIDRYTIRNRLGQGGMAVVYRAKHNQLGTEHAIKVLMVPSPSIRARLLTEGRVQATLRHQNIVSVTDVIDVGGAPGLVMELVVGPSLDQLLNQLHLSIDQVDELARGILAGVAQAHRHGLIHRDLKPANVMLQETEFGFIPKVTDFGLAKILDASEGVVGTQTRSGVAMGTPCYMAPEQVRNAKGVDKRADVFSLGAMLYEMLSAVRPFAGEDLFEIFNAITSGKYVPLRTRMPDVPERMARAVEAALQVDREARVADCDKLLAIWTGQDAPAKATGPWSAEMLARVRSPTSAMPAAVSEGTWDGSREAQSNESMEAVPVAMGLNSVLAAANAEEARVGGAPARNQRPQEAESEREQTANPTLAARSVENERAAEPPAVGVASEREARAAADEPKPGSRLGIGVVGGIATLLVVGFVAWQAANSVGVPAAEAEVAVLPASVGAPDAQVTAGGVTGGEVSQVALADRAVTVVGASGVATGEPASLDPTITPTPAATPPPPSAAATAPKSASGEAKTTSVALPVKSVAKAPVVAPPDAVSSAPATSPVGKGMLSVNSRPWSNVILDGVPEGRTGNWKREMPEGRHEIVLSTADGRTVTKSVTVTAGGDTPLCWDFELGANCPK